MHIHKCETKQQRGSSSSSRFHESAVFAWKLPFLATLLSALSLCSDILPDQTHAHIAAIASKSSDREDRIVGERISTFNSRRNRLKKWI